MKKVIIYTLISDFVREKGKGVCGGGDGLAGEVWEEWGWVGRFFFAGASGNVARVG